MFTDPQSVIISSITKSLPRTDEGDRSGTYTLDDETIQLTISHMTTNKGRVRRCVRLDVNKLASDPFTANQSRKFDISAYLVLEEDEQPSFTNAEILANTKGLIGWLSDANLTKVIAGES